MPIPQTNATLIAINRGGFTEDYDRTSGSASPIWTGAIDAYVQRKIVSNFNSNDELQRVLQVTMFLSMDLPTVMEPGDIVTYQAGNPDSLTTLAGKVQDIVDPALLPSLEDYYKIALEEVNVP